MLDVGAFEWIIGLLDKTCCIQLLVVGCVGCIFLLLVIAGLEGGADIEGDRKVFFVRIVGLKILIVIFPF